MLCNFRFSFFCVTDILKLLSHFHSLKFPATWGLEHRRTSWLGFFHPSRTVSCWTWNCHFTLVIRLMCGPTKNWFLFFYHVNTQEWEKQIKSSWLSHSCSFPCFWCSGEQYEMWGTVSATHRSSGTWLGLIWPWEVQWMCQQAASEKDKIYSLYSQLDWKRARRFAHFIGC